MMDSRKTDTSCLIILFLWCALSILAAAHTVSEGVPEGFTVAPFTAEIWAENLTRARGLVVDDVGDVLVVLNGTGIYALWDDGEVNRTLLVNSSSLNHGISLYENHVYASSGSTVWRWNYTAGQRRAAVGQETVVVNMNVNENGIAMVAGHQSRTLAIDDNGTLYVSIGSMSNVDSNSFRARIRSFNLSRIPSGGYDFVRQGVVFADGVRNEVGLAFDGRGRLWGVENGADELERDDLGGDIHDDNPAEELNLFDGRPGTFYGYPYCWSEYLLTRNGSGRGSQWAWPSVANATITDAWCRNRSNVRRPELSMQAHSAPLGITFYDGMNCGNVIHNATDHASEMYSLACDFEGDAFVAFHGSWNRDPPVGFNVARIQFNNATGLPARTNDSSAIFNIFGAQNPETDCADDSERSTCIRPVDVKFDKKGALLVTSDTTGQIIRITQNISAASAPASPPSSPSSASRLGQPIGKLMILSRVLVSLLVCILGWSSADFV